MKDPKPQLKPSWGREKDVTIANVALCLSILLFCPLLVLYFWSSCTYYECSLYSPIQSLIENNFSSEAFQTFVLKLFPKPTNEGFLLFFGWLIFQGVLYAIVPAKIGYGQRTPAGYLLPYKVNGLSVWIISHVLFVAGSFLGIFPGSIIHDNWGGLLVAANFYGYLLTIFSYLKAHLFPTHPEDRKFSGSFIYDLYMGIEFNPRFGQLWDFKLFHNGRPGIVAWTLINLSFAAAQYQQMGYVTNSMITLNLLHAIYVVDFFYHEDWYLRTIDIAHDHFGFYLAWGDSVWLPFMYTLQSHYLVRNPVDLTTTSFILINFMGLLGYYIFRMTNNQKDIVRRTDGKCEIWGKPAKVIRTEYTTSDGKKHKSLLLICGFWGISRHFNYVGDLLMCLAFCLTCGTQHLLPYFYIIYMTILLVHRIHRDDSRCRNKYGKYWDQFCKAVPYKLIPYIY